MWGRQSSECVTSDWSPPAPVQLSHTCSLNWNLDCCLKRSWMKSTCWLLKSWLTGPRETMRVNSYCSFKLPILGCFVNSTRLLKSQALKTNIAVREWRWGRSIRQQVQRNNIETYKTWISESNIGDHYNGRWGDWINILTENKLKICTRSGCLAQQLIYCLRCMHPTLSSWFESRSSSDPASWYCASWENAQYQVPPKWDRHTEFLLLALT